MTDRPPPPSPGPDGPESAPAGPRKYPLERRIVGVIVLAAIVGIIVHGAAAIFRESFRIPATPSPYAHCSTGIGDLHNDFAMQLSVMRHSGGVMVPYRPLEDPSVRARLAELDEALLALRPVCEREGPEARDAYESLTVWRHRLQDIARIEERTLTPDAERALRYRSPSADGTPADGTPPGRSPAAAPTDSGTRP